MSPEVTAQVAWYNLEKAVEAVQAVEAGGPGDYQSLLDTVRAAIFLLLEHEDRDVLEQVRASALPLRPTVSWLVFEAGRIIDIPPRRVDSLRQCWQEECADEHGDLLPPPPAHLGI